MKTKKLLSVAVSSLLVASSLVGTLGLSACGGGSDANTIRYIAYSGGGALDDSYRIVKKVDEIVYEKLGFHVDIEYVGYNTYAEKLGLYMDSAEDFDMCYSGSLLSGLTYSNRAANGYFADITKALPEHAPELYASMSEQVWEAAKVDGKIYGVINEQMFARTTGVAIDKEIAAELGLTQEKIDEEGLTYQDVIKQAMNHIQNDPTISPDTDGDGKGNVPSTTLVIGNVWDDIYMQTYGLDALGMDSYYPGLIEAADGKTTVFNQYESDYFKEMADFCREMHENGWIAKSQATVPITSNQRVRVVGCYYPDVAENTLYTSIGREFEIFKFGTPLMTTVNVTSSMTAIYARSKKVDKCLKFLNLLYTDKDLYNLLAIGEEDLEYKWNTGYDENDQQYDYISMIKTSKYKPYADWAFGSELNTYRKRGYAEDWAQKIRDFNNSATFSPAYGFTYVPAYSMKANLDNCYMIANEYITKWTNGTFNSAKTNQELIDEMNGKMSSYVNQILTTKQSQLDAFLAK